MTPAALEQLAVTLRARPQRPLPVNGEGLAESSVLVPLRHTPSGLEVIFTLRPENLRRHAGQISFPGGRREPEDKDRVETALRETEEELGIPRDRVRILGPLDECPTPTGYRIQPYVGVVDASVTLVPQIEEVAEVLLVPWSHLVDVGNQQVEKRLIFGREIDSYVFNWHVHRIWGATAFIVHNLLKLTDSASAFPGKSESR